MPVAASPSHIPSSSTPIPSTSVTPGAEVVERDDAHKHRRRFIGPLPESVVSQAVAPTKKAWFGLWTHHERQEDEDAKLRDVIKDHALQFFLRHGGKKEDWGETTERHVREEMMKKWRDSEWGKLRKRAKEAKQQNKRWVGGSFDVGVFLGVDMLSDRVRTPEEDDVSILDEYPTGSRAPASTLGETFVTAPSHMSEYESTAGPSTSTQLHSSQNGLTEPDHGDEDMHPHSADSSTALLTPQIIVRDPEGRIHSDVVTHTLASLPPPLSTVQSEPILALNGKQDRKGKGKDVHVHYEDTPAMEAQASEPPVPAEEVLARRGTEVEDTSAGAAEQATAQNQVDWGDVILRGTI